MTRIKHRYTYQIATKDLDTPQSVVAELEKLSVLLPASELSQMGSFNRAYLIVTKEINLAASLNRFKYPAVMDELEVAFAKRYFEALNRYVREGSLPGAWRRVNRGWFHRRHPASLSLLLGANAHINYDLLRPLQEVIREPQAFREDYFRVNQLLLDSSKTIVASYYESEGSLNFFKKNLRVFYLKPVMWVILRWRTRVWSELLLLPSDSD